MNIIRVGLKEDAYSIFIKPGIFDEIKEFVRRSSLGNFAFVLTSKSLYKAHRGKIKRAFRGIGNHVMVLPDGESAKSVQWFLNILERMAHNHSFGRSLYVVCVGGGTVGDVGAFAASVYKRGIPYIQVPTTLLAQIDAGIGGKTAIDLPAAKNIIGSFYQPRAVLCDTQFLSTLPLGHVREGFAEAVKYGIIKDKELFAWLFSSSKKIVHLSQSQLLGLIKRCAAIKAKIVSLDPKEKKGIRTILNFGHTLAHAIEASSKYRAFSHGQAVSIGMVYAAYLSYLLGMCSKGEYVKVRQILELFGLPTRIKIDEKKILIHMAHDKKFTSGRNRFVLLKEIGSVTVVEGISKALLCKAFEGIR